MKPGIVYSMRWDLAPVASSTGGSDRQAVQTMSVAIYDRGVMIPDDDDAQLIELTPAGSPLEIIVVDNDENKFQPIRSKQAKIRFASNQSEGQDITAFADGYDNQFYVTVFCDIAIVFYGFLMLPDAQMPFQPDPNIVELTASDHLPLLKDIALVNSAGDNPSGKFRIAELIMLCLNKTGVSLPLNVINNLRAGGGARTTGTATFAAADDSITVAFYIGFFYVGQTITITGSVSNNITTTVTAIVSSTKITVSDSLVNETVTIYNVTFTDAASVLHFYDGIELDAKTFEAEVGTSEDCYTVLTKILGDDCCVFQSRGEWWIIRIDEYDNNPLYRARFNTDGELTADPAVIDLDYSIGFDQNVIFANADQVLRCERPHKFVKEIFRYNNPAEIVCNIDFDRGAVISAPDLSAPSSTGTYSVECWTLHRYAGGSPTSTMYIKKRFEFGYEKERYLVITPASSSSETTWAECQPIPVQVKDRATVSVEYSSESDFGSGEGNVEYDIVFIWIVDPDGNYYYWSNIDEVGTTIPNYRWVGPFVSETNRPVSESWILDEVDETDPRNLTVNLDAFPVAGNLYLGLPQFNQTGSSFDNSVVIQYNISFSYDPFINGSYQKYTGHTNSVIRTSNDYAAKRENEVFIGDSPRPIFKGSMFLSTEALTSVFYPAAKYALTGTPDPSQVKPYGWHQAFAVWNQYRTGIRVFTGSLQGLGDDWPDLLHRFTLTDSNPNTTGRYFLLISFQQDFRTSSWRATFIECYNEDTGRTYDDPHEFKYLTQ